MAAATGSRHLAVLIGGNALFIDHLPNRPIRLMADSTVYSHLQIRDS